MGFNRYLEKCLVRLYLSPKPIPNEKRHTPLITPTQPDFDHVKLVSSIWKKILGTNEIDLQRNFFENGGNSLLATELAFDLGEKLNITVL